MPPDLSELAAFPAHVGRIVREAVTVAAQTANRERDEALADRIGVAVVRELALFFTKRPAGGEG